MIPPEVSVNLQPSVNAGLPQPSLSRPICARSLSLLITGWFLIALLVGETQILSILPPPVIPAIVLTLASLLLLAYFKWSCFRTRISHWPAESLVALHLTRFVGIYFLYLHSKGQLPGSFAVAAGWGDIAIASGAIIVLLIRRPSAILIWNILGLADILFVVINAARLVTTTPEAMAPFMKLPLSFLPTFLVPMIIATHIILFHRLLSARRRSSAMSQPRTAAVQA